MVDPSQRRELVGKDPTRLAIGPSFSAYGLSVAYTDRLVLADIYTLEPVLPPLQWPRPIKAAWIARQSGDDALWVAVQDAGGVQAYRVFAESSHLVRMAVPGLAEQRVGSPSGDVLTALGNLARVSWNAQHPRP